MDKAEREALEAELSEQLDCAVIVSEYMPKTVIYLFDMTENPHWFQELKKWVAVPADVASMPNASEVVKSVILENIKTGPMRMVLSKENLVSLRFTD